VIIDQQYIKKYKIILSKIIIDIQLYIFSFQFSPKNPLYIPIFLHFQNLNQLYQKLNYYFQNVSLPISFQDAIYFYLQEGLSGKV